MTQYNAALNSNLKIGRTSKIILTYLFSKLLLGTGESTNTKKFFPLYNLLYCLPSFRDDTKPDLKKTTLKILHFTLTGQKSLSAIMVF
jgi:hypothetical protein